MRKSTNYCKYGHTPCVPHKERMRSDLLWRIGRDALIITVSYALVSGLQYTRHQGPIIMADLDPAVRAQIEFCRSGDYPDLARLIHPAQGDIREAVEYACSEYSSEVLRKGATDLDLKEGIKEVLPILRGVALTLIEHKAWGHLIALTFCQRDRFKSRAARLSHLRACIPKGLRIIRFEPYVSLVIGEHAERSSGLGGIGSKGSSMCVVWLEVVDPLKPYRHAVSLSSLDDRAGFVRNLLEKFRSVGIAKTEVKRLCHERFPFQSTQGLNSWLSNAKNGTGSFRGPGPLFRERNVNGVLTLFPL